jgi:hypothetical protein
MVLPNPFRLGTETGGPLVSCHSNKKVPSPFARFTSHVIETRPPLSLIAMQHCDRGAEPIVGKLMALANDLWRIASPEAQAIFCRRRHQPRRPPPPNIRPGSSAPTMGPGTGTGTSEASGKST